MNDQLSFLYRYWLAALLPALLLGGCSGPGKKDIRNYYYPLKTLEDGLVYEYRPVGLDSLTPVYWYYRSFVQPNGVFLTGTYYEYDLIPLQLVKEEMVENGMLLSDLAVYTTDSMGLQQPILAKVLAGNVFPFEVSDSNGVFLFKVQLVFPDAPEASTTLIKNRRYLGDTTIVFDNQKLKAIRFGVRELIEDRDPEDGVVEPTLSGEEVYAEGIGLVYYYKNITSTQQLAYRLVRRYPMVELEDQFREKELQAREE